MAEGTKENSTLLRGQIGDRIYQVKNGKQVVYEAPVYKLRKERSVASLTRTVHFAMLAALWKSLKGALEETFERTSKGQSMYNLFQKYNLDSYRPFATKEETEEGCRVLDFVEVSHGSLEPHIEAFVEGDAVVSDICVGDLVIDETTTVRELSGAIIQNNGTRFYEGDSLLFVQALQLPGVRAKSMEEKPIQPSVETRHYQFLLDQHSPRLTYEEVWPAGFTSYERDGRRYLSGPRREGMMMAWVQSRMTGRGDLRLTTQRLVGMNSLIERYCDEFYRVMTFNSYGGVTLRNAASPNNPVPTRPVQKPRLPNQPDPKWD